jgi:hypothetical protein
VTGRSAAGASTARLTAVFWAIIVVFYAIRTYCWQDPATELAWKVHFRGETGLIDRAEAVLWLPAIVLNVLLAVDAWRRGRWSLTTVWFVGMSALCVFLLGEEVSWGQHVFGFEPTEKMTAVNAQQESNLHNLNLALILGVAPESPFYPWLTNFNHILNPAFYLLATVLWVGIPVAKRVLAWRLLAPIPAPHTSIAVFFAANVVAYLLVDKLVFDVGEIFEFAIVSTFVLAALDIRQSLGAIEAVRPRVGAVVEDAPSA